MANVTVSNVEVKDNPSKFTSPFQFEITFTCEEDLNDDLEWKIIYVGSAESELHDQTLDSVLVGPVAAGKHMFVFTADPPDFNKLPRDEVVGVTVVLLTCSFRNQEFIRVGYYVNNEYEDPELKENPPSSPAFEKLVRNILATCPRVTRFRINWGGETSEGTSSGAVANGEMITQDGAALMPPPSAELKLPPVATAAAMDADSNMVGEASAAAHTVIFKENSNSGLEHSGMNSGGAIEHNGLELRLNGGHEPMQE